jgi:hypothetical protein
MTFFGYNGYSMGKNDRLEACIGSLQSLSDEPCHFIHECSDLADPLQCDEATQEQCLGCAHSGLVVLKEAINTLDGKNLLPKEHAVMFRNRLDATFFPVLRLDQAAIREYEERGELSDSTKMGESQIIRERAAVRDTLLHIAQSARRSL